jgi:hypothetical protein
MASTVILLLSASPLFPAETWHLDQKGDWKPVSAEGEDKYLLAVAQIKKLKLSQRNWINLKKTFRKLQDLIWMPL